MRLALTAAVLCLAVGCSSATSSSAEAGSAAPTRAGTATLKMLCPEVHRLVDSLVASSPDSQHEFVVQVERLQKAADSSTREVLTVLLDAAKALEKAGVGSDFYAARDGIHPAVVSVNAGCARLGEPILHAGPHRIS